MLKHQVIKEAHNQGINLTEHQLRRYVQYGLLLSDRESHGFKSGVKANYSNESINIIKEIETLKKEGYNTKNEIIFMLFMKGYKVNGKKLQKHLMNYIDEINYNAEYIAEFSNNHAEEFEWFLEEKIEKFMRPRDPGRPNHKEQEVYDKQKEQEKLKIKTIITMMSEIYIKGSVSNNTGYQLLQSVTQEQEFTPNTEDININDWRYYIQSLTNDDIHEIQKVIMLMKNYIEVIQNITLPIELQKTVEPILTLINNADIASLLNHSEIIKFSSLALSDRKKRKSILNFITFNETVQSKNDFQSLLTTRFYIGKEDR